MHMDIGMNLNQVLAIRAPSVLPKGANGTQLMMTLMQQLRQVPSIEGMTSATALPGDGFNWYKKSWNTIYR